MGKQRSSLRQVPWQSWEHWNWVATELFADSSDRVSSALDRIAAWQSRGKVPVAVETSAAIIGIHHRDPQVNHGIPEESALPEEMLRMMYAMAIQRLVNGVVDQSQKRNSASVADRAELAGLPRLLVDVRHEAAHTELPGLPLLRVASRQALAWLKTQYWDQQRESLVTARLELKVKLVEHHLLVVDILNPSCVEADPQQSEDEQESDSETEKSIEVDPQETLRAKKQQRSRLFNDLLDLSLSSMTNLISILVDDGLLEQDTRFTEGECHSKNESITASRDCDDLTSVMGSAWKFTLRELSTHLPRLPEMLVVAIINQLGKSLGVNSLHFPGDAEATTLPAPHFSSDELADHASKDCTRRKRMVSWCAWLLGKRSVQDNEDTSEKEPRKLKLLKISNSLFVKTNLSKELLGELLRLCLSTSNGREPLGELVSLISRRLGNERFHHRVAALAHLGTSIQNAHRDVINASGEQEVSMATQGKEGGLDGSSEKSSSPLGEEARSVASEPPETALEVARNRQSVFLSRFSLHRKQANTSDTMKHKELGRDGPPRFHNRASIPSTGSDVNRENSAVSTSVERRQGGSGVQSWTVVEDWRPCAIGMIPSPFSSVGVLPSLDLNRQVDDTERVLFEAASLPCEGSVVVTESSVQRVDQDSSVVADRPGEAAVGKRTTDAHPDESFRGKKVRKSGRHVHFKDGPVDVDAEGVASEFGDSLRGPSGAASRQKEMCQTNSLLRGCLMQQGLFSPVTSQQLESLKSAVHVL